MKAAPQLTLAPTPTLPLDPFELAATGWGPWQRGQFYNRCEPPLDSFQRGATEQALRLIAVGRYQGAER